MRRKVLMHGLENWVDPVAVFAALDQGSPCAFWLDSGPDATTGMSYIGTSERWVTAAVDDGTVTEHPSGIITHATVFQTIADSLAGGVDTAPGAGAFQLGWVGWLGYELHQQTMATGLTTRSKHPDAAFAWVDRVIAFDHAARSVSLLALGDTW